MCGQICMLGCVCVSWALRAGQCMCEYIGLGVCVCVCVCVCVSKPVCPPAWICVVIVYVLADGASLEAAQPCGGHCPGPLPPASRDEGQREGRVSPLQVLLPGDDLSPPCQGVTWLESSLPPPLLLRVLCVLPSTCESVTCLRG